MSKKIILTGGGTAGHVTPNLALIPKLESKGYEILYIGSYTGIEKKLIEEAGVKYVGISSGKLRRYFDVKNFTDPFRVMKGYFQAKKIIKDFKPDVLFSKGGFVSVPVCLAAKKRKIPTIIHESDMTPGLANKLAFSSASKVCCNFPETVKYLPEGKGVYTGSPIRENLLAGDKNKGYEITGFNSDKPVILVTGGSIGSVAVNNLVREILPELLKEFQVMHLCGKGNLDESLEGTAGYKQQEYANEELKDLFALSDLIVSRAGANTICEILALHKPNILIPLPASASRGDQVLNAKSFSAQGFSKMLTQETLTGEMLLREIKDLYEHKDAYIEKMVQSEATSAVETIINMLEGLTK